MNLPSSLCHWHSCLLFSLFTLSLWSALLLPQLSSPYALLLSLSTPQGFYFSLSLGFTLLATFTVTTNSVLFTALGSLTRTETSLLGQKLANDNAFLQILLLAISEPNTNSVEIVIWLWVLTVYTSLRVCLSACEARLETNTAVGSCTTLLLGVVGVTLAFVGTTSWLFWTAGVGLLLQMHYEGVQIALIAGGHVCAAVQDSGEFAVTEIVLTGAAHVVALVQWGHFLLDSVEILGFPIQFFLFYKLGRAIHQVRTDVWRYRGYRESVNTLLERCPVLPGEEVERMGEERCCMCWEKMGEFECARLPCKHVHHV